MSRADRKLKIAFHDAAGFQQEYAANLVNGGIFIASDECFELRERVTVEILAIFCRKKLTLTGEVVHIVTPEMATLGTVGAAVQFEGAASEVRKRLEPLRTAAGADEHRPPDSGRRAAPRTPARVAALLEARDHMVEGHTRNLSQVGVLVAVPGKAIPVGEVVAVTLTHPTTGENRSVEGVIARHVGAGDGVSGLGIQFSPKDHEREALATFVEAIQTSEHTRRLGGIHGEIDEIGVAGVLQMVAQSAPAGTLTLRGEESEGLVGFEGGMLRFARVGTASGMKALVRMLAWSAGSFEFHSRLDPVSQSESPLPLEAALLEGTRLLDEGNRLDLRNFPAEAVPKLAGDAGGDDLSKLEAAVLDLVRVGFPVRRMVDVIPEPDPEIYAAFEALRDRGLIRL